MKKYEIPGYRKQFQDLYGRLYPELINHQNIDVEKNGKVALLTKNITFVVTEDCNLRCTYCYECNKNYKAVMSKEVAMKAVDMILDDNRMEGYVSSKETPCIILEFIGGEPLIEIELMDFIVDYFRYKAVLLNHIWANNYMINVTSNGILYNDPRVQQFINKNQGRVSITITIDGDKQLHDSCRVFPNGAGSYDIVVNSIKKAIEQVGLSDTKVTFAPSNIQYISKAIPHLFDLGLTTVNANCVFEDVWKKEDCIPFYKELIKLADYMLDNKVYEYASCSIFEQNLGYPMPEEDNKNWCGGNGQMLAIGTDGRMFPCIRFMRYSLSNPDIPEIEIGSIDRGLDKEEDNELLACVNCITRKSQSTEECFNCPVAQGCAWCTAYNYDKFGTPNKRATFICWMHKARVLANYYYWNKLSEITGEDMKFKLHLKPEDVKYIQGEE